MLLMDINLNTAFQAKLIVYFFTVYLKYFVTSKKKKIILILKWTMSK